LRLSLLEYYALSGKISIRNPYYIFFQININSLLKDTTYLAISIIGPSLKVYDTLMVFGYNENDREDTLSVNTTISPDTTTGIIKDPKWIYNCANIFEISLWNFFPDLNTKKYDPNICQNNKLWFLNTFFIIISDKYRWKLTKKYTSVINSPGNFLLKYYKLKDSNVEGLKNYSLLKFRNNNVL